MKHQDARLRIVGPVGLYVFVSLFFRLDLYLHLSLEAALTNAFIAVTAGISCWNLARWVVLRMQERFPGLANTRRRLGWLLVVAPLLIGFAWLLRHFIRFLISGTFVYFTDAVELSRNIGIQIFYHFIYFAIYEGWYILEQWKQETIQTSLLEKVSLRSQLSSLQQQVNPHFLFNSLNSLSSLISESATQADTFLEELTAVFRYQLQASEQRLVPLRDELAFIRSYGYLLRTRYQQGFLLDINVDPAHEMLFIPPLTLQVLVENAVRYNLILPQQPLRIRIYSMPGLQLRVDNTLQHKALRVDTGGEGLTNLATQYRLLDPNGLLIKEQSGWFIVSLPLLTEARSLELV